jgi:hypothetical protein
MLQGLLNNGNGTLSDKQTGLMWQLDDDGIQRSYEEATGYCQTLELAGHNDWRLPNKEELLTLAAYDFDTLKQAFLQIKSERYWANTTMDELYWAEAPDRIAYTVDFDPNSGNYKQPITYFKRYSYYVRAVRNATQNESNGCVTEQKTCSNCDGLGKTIFSILFKTGETKYKTCEVCNGSGVICGSEKAYYSKYPDVSLSKAQELIRKFGNPAQIDILSDEVNLHFADGSKFILGGFTVGYRGTGPDFTHRLLQACDFNVSMDEIASMEPPITLYATKQARETKKADTYYQIDYENGTIPIGDLPIGARVVDPSWEWEFRTGGNYTGNGEKKSVTWIVVAKDHYSGLEPHVTLLSEETIGRHAFDNSNDRDHEYAEWGYNHWGESGSGNATHGLRPWLNSAGIHAGEGFYKAFSESFRNAVLTTAVPNREWKNGSSYSTNDKVFIPSLSELDSNEDDRTYKIGTIYPYFNKGWARINSLLERTFSYADRQEWQKEYWTRSPDLYYGSLVLGVDYHMHIIRLKAYFSGVGVGPALNLKSETLVSEIKD